MSNSPVCLGLGLGLGLSLGLGLGLSLRCLHCYVLYGVYDVEIDSFMRLLLKRLQTHYQYPRKGRNS